MSIALRWPPFPFAYALNRLLLSTMVNLFYSMGIRNISRSREKLLQAFAKFAYIMSPASHRLSSVKRMQSETEVRKQIYCCDFCKFVQQNLELEQLDPSDERKYLFHLKHTHNLEP